MLPLWAARSEGLKRLISIPHQAQREVWEGIIECGTGSYVEGEGDHVQGAYINGREDSPGAYLGLG